MRVPDEIRKSVLFIGVREDLPEWEWRGTGYLIAVPDARFTFTESARHKGRAMESSVSYPLMFLATARHVAEKLEGHEFALRTNWLDGSIAVIEGHADQKWWYHPTEKKYVDAAVTVFRPQTLTELDVHWIGTDTFADQQTVEEAALGVGDEVFIAGLFTKVQETTRNIPVVRIGNIAMMPGEKIPFKDGRLIDAYLVECRSTGGLSGSPVFVRQTIRMEGYTASGQFYDSRHKPLAPNEVVVMSGLGRIYFLGSMIGHWDAPSGFHFSDSEMVNMGISVIVPAHKIKEILMQPELMKLARNMTDGMGAKERHNVA